ncbi:MAG: hypothetical protein WCO29_20120 [Nostocales cyanobacterium ELA583]
MKLWECNTGVTESGVTESGERKLSMTTDKSARNLSSGLKAKVR